MCEDNLRRGLVITAGDPTPFFTRPISVILAALLLLSILGPTRVGQAAQAWVSGRFGRRTV